MTQRGGHNVEHLGADLEFPSLLLYLVHQCMAYLAIIDNARGGHANGSDAGNMRFHFFYFFRTKPHRRYAIL